MTRTQRLRLARAQLLIRQRLERTLEVRLRAELVRAAQDISSAYPAIQPAMRRHLLQLNTILAQGSMRAANAGVAYAMAQRGKALTEAQLTAATVAAARARAKLQAIAVAKTTRERVMRVIADGLEVNDAPAVIARSIVSQVGEMSIARARTIARTETAVAMNTAQNDSMTAMAEDLGLTVYKIWTASEDERTRESHAAADGQAVPLADAFKVGGAELMFPSDPDGPSEEVINCRCVPVYDTR